jgi:RNA polymerase sigma-70 factor (ECF subfamily)
MTVRIDPADAGVPAVEVVPERAVSAADRVAAFQACFASESAFRRFYDAALPRVYGYLFNRCRGDSSIAEDLTQVAFTEALRRRATYDGRADPVTWVIGIARHKLIDQFRTEARDERRRMQLVVHELEVDQDAASWNRALEGEALRAALDRLTAMQRAVLILHYADGLPIREVAAAIHRSESATESLMTRAREALRVAFEETDDA